MVHPTRFSSHASFGLKADTSICFSPQLLNFNFKLKKKNKPPKNNKNKKTQTNKKPKRPTPQKNPPHKTTVKNTGLPVRYRNFQSQDTLPVKMHSCHFKVTSRINLPVGLRHSSLEKVSSASVAETRPSLKFHVISAISALLGL